MIKPIQSQQKFETIEEFNTFYESNRDIFENNSTCKLNKMFEIPGFRITKLKGVISLKNVPTSRVNLSDRIEKIEEKLNQMVEVVNSLVTYVNGSQYAV